MTLKFGDDLDDITADEAALSDLLTNARNREAQAFDHDGEPIETSWEDGALPPDPEPGYEQPRDWKERLFGEKQDTDGEQKPKAPRVTVAIRKDVRGKTGLFLAAVGTFWERRDPHCGGTFMQTLPSYKDEDGEQVDGLVDALTDIFCDSPDVVRWFTTSGKFMKYLNLISILEPVCGVVFSHHVMHREPEEMRKEQDWSAYGAGG